ncbi:MAG: ABC transporter permease [Armatimonadetes bacterium]|nr:ABC transporter permease [Armatimonadota bacterium]
MRRTRAIARKEWIHILRDKRSLAAVLTLPVVLVLLYGYAVNFDLNALSFALVDDDHSAASRHLAENLSGVRPFVFKGTLANAAEADSVFQRGIARVVVVVPAGFERLLDSGRPSPVQVLVDGSEGTIATIAQTYTVGAISTLGRTLTKAQAQGRGISKRLLEPAIDVRVRVLYNPDLLSRMFLVPGLIGIILMMLAALLTSGIIVRERESGTFELLAASPIGPMELLVGKMLPYLIIGAADVVVAVGMGWAVFGVEPKGSLLLLFALSLVYVLASSAIGLFFSCVARSQQTAMMMAFVATVIPTMILSGFAFPVRNIPLVLQGLSQMLPATHYIAIARGIILKGIGLGPIWWHGLALALLTVFWMRLALRKFSKTL